MTIYPSPLSADMVSILSSVFENKSVKGVHEIEPVVSKNAQTMSLLQSPLNPNQASAVVDSRKKYKNFVATVDNEALSNENTSSVGDASSVSKEYTSDRISLYTVRSGDSVEQVAKMYGVSPSTILWANDLKKGVVLKDDQVLVIMPMLGVKYVVKTGDTLDTVAKAYKMGKDEIANFNNIESGAVLALGDEIIIPDAEGGLTAAEQKKQDEKDAKNAKDALDKAKKDKQAKALAKNKAISKKDTLATDDSPATHADTSGYFTRPINGGVRTQGLHGHNGIDLASSYGTPILAAASGEVVIAKPSGWNGGYGDYVVIQHPNGTQTLYGHLSDVTVHAGDSIGKGEQIGKMGNTGESTGVHLHFEVRGGKNPF